MSDSVTIGIFDSGYGGLSVLSEALDKIPQAHFLYYADSDHVPYGSRGNEEIYAFSDGAVSFLRNEGADAVILACNTASAVSSAGLREKYDFPIIAMEPAVRPALQEENAGRILIMATPVTLREEKLKNLILREHGEERTDLLAMPQLVSFAEEERFDGPAVESYLAERLSAFDLSKYSAIVLGCTHFNYFKPALRTYLKSSHHETLHLIEGSAGTVRRAADLLGLCVSGETQNASFSNAADLRRVRFFCSGREVTDEKEREKIRRLMHRLREKTA